MDEPLSSLDAPERLRMALIIKSVIKIEGISTLYVTHSPQEAEILSDVVFMLDQGKILQTGSISNIRRFPNSRKVATLVGIPNVFSTPPPIPGAESSVTSDGLCIISPERIVEDSTGVGANVVAETSTGTYLKVGESFLLSSQQFKDKNTRIRII